MNKSKFGRHLGVGKNYHGSLPPVGISVDLSVLARAPLSSGGSGRNQGSCCQFVIIDPPLGGFAPGDILVQWPNALGSAPTVAAPVALDTEKLLAPGHWRIDAYLRPAAIAGLTLVIQFLGYDELAGAWIAPAGGIPFPDLGMKIISNTVDIVQNFRALQLYFPRPWAARLITLTAMTDAHVSAAWFSAQPVHLLDDNPSHE